MLINRSTADVDKGESYTEDGINSRLHLAGDCDEVVRRLVIDLDWVDEFRQLLPDLHKDFV